MSIGEELPLDDYYRTDEGRLDPKTVQEARASMRIDGNFAWFACRAPEKPLDLWTHFHDRCSRCLVATQAALARGEGGQHMVDTMVERLEELGEAEE